MFGVNDMRMDTTQFRMIFQVASIRTSSMMPGFHVKNTPVEGLIKHAPNPEMRDVLPRSR
jgi:hypothetical protein